MRFILILTNISLQVPESNSKWRKQPLYRTQWSCSAMVDMGLPIFEVLCHNRKSCCRKKLAWTWEAYDEAFEIWHGWYSWSNGLWVRSFLFQVASRSEGELFDRFFYSIRDYLSPSQASWLRNKSYALNQASGWALNWALSWEN